MTGMRRARPRMPPAERAVLKESARKYDHHRRGEGICGFEAAEIYLGMQKRSGRSKGKPEKGFLVMRIPIFNQSWKTQACGTMASFVTRKLCQVGYRGGKRVKHER